MKGIPGLDGRKRTKGLPDEQQPVSRILTRTYKSLELALVPSKECRAPLPELEVRRAVPNNLVGQIGDVRVP
ncbi:MAG: hypothetical protein ABFR47_09420 [Verrucomicrobiota bacterium]